MHAFLIDDDDSAIESAKRFSTETLEFQFRKPGPLESFAGELFDAKPAMIVVDYRLDERAGESGHPARYKASALAQQLRDLAGDDGPVDFPIVLHSAEQKIKQHYRPEKTAHDLFDHVIRKEARKDDELEKRRLDALATGYKRLVELRPYGKHLPDIFGLDKKNAFLIDHQEIRDLAEATRIPHVLARFILKRLIKRNSILIDEGTVLARCGVDAADAGKKILFQELDRLETKYAGVFSQFRPLWWRLPVETVIEEWLGGPVNRFTAKERVAILSEKFGYNFNPAVSQWNGSPDERLTQVCTLCGLPTMVAHSVAVHEVTTGPLAERRRICFNCIQDDRHLERPDLAIDALDRPTEIAVRKGEIKGK